MLTAQQEIVFENPGELNIDFIKLMGVSVKDNENAIGYFGTGLKYAIAVLLREDCAIRILSGKKEYTFDTLEKEIRGKTFQVVRMNQQELGFTTELGKKWELWQAYREIYCNMTDELGEDRTVMGEEVYGEDNKTKIVIGGYRFLDVHNTRNDFILRGTPIATVPGLEIHQGQTHYVYYKGIRVFTDGEKFRFTYNITCPLELSEDRQVKWEFDMRRILCRGFVQVKDPEIIEQLVNPEVMENRPERFFDFASCSNPSPEFTKIVKQRQAQGPGKVHFSLGNIIKVDRGTILGAESNRYAKTDGEGLMLETAIQLCEQAGYTIDEFEINSVKWIGENIQAAAFGGEIWLTKDLFAGGVGSLVHALIEEWAHLKYGFKDCTREFQNWWSKELASKVAQR